MNIASVCFVLAVLSTYFPLKKALLGVKGGLGIGDADLLRELHRQFFAFRME